MQAAEVLHEAIEQAPVSDRYDQLILYLGIFIDSQITAARTNRSVIDFVLSLWGTNDAIDSALIQSFVCVSRSTPLPRDQKRSILAALCQRYTAGLDGNRQPSLAEQTLSSIQILRPSRSDVKDLLRSLEVHVASEVPVCQVYAALMLRQLAVSVADFHSLVSSGLVIALTRRAGRPDAPVDLFKTTLSAIIEQSPLPFRRIWLVLVSEV